MARRTAVAWVRRLRRLSDRVRRWRTLSTTPGRDAVVSLPEPAAGSVQSIYGAFRGLISGERPRVAILADSPGAAVEEAVRAITRVGRPTVFVISPEEFAEWVLDETSVRWLRGRTLAAIHAQLVAVGPVDGIIDMLGESLEDDERPLSHLFFHLRPHGWYLVTKARGNEPTARTNGPRASVLSFMNLYWSGGQQASPRGLNRELVESCAQIKIDRSAILMQKRHKHYVKLRDGNVARALPTRNARDTVTTLRTIPEGQAISRGTITHHNTIHDVLHMPSTVDYPQAHLLHYEGKITLGSNSLLYTDTAVLPASYRYPTAEVLSNPRIKQVDKDFARIPQQVRPTRVLKGSYYHLDCWYSGHFGHIMAEVVARMWGWHEAKDRVPDLKAIFRRRYPNERHPGIELALFKGLGIDRKSIVWVDEPVRLSSVVTASPLWQNVEPYFVNPLITDTWRRLRDGMVDRLAATPERIFVSRRSSSHENRACRNVEAVEAIFVQHGYTVVYPEDYTQHEQATLFAGATTVGGFAGSALYNLLFTEKLRTLIVLTHDAYTARYEHLMSIALGCETHYFWSRPDISQPVGGWSREAYYSSWEFDAVGAGAELRDLLATVT